MTLAVGRVVSAGSAVSIGTAFAVNDVLALTAAHCTRGQHAAILVEFGGTTVRAHVVDADLEGDVALLQLDDALPPGLYPVPLSDEVHPLDLFTAPGFPLEIEQADSFTASGWVKAVSTPIKGGFPALELFCQESAAELPLKGLSGAPVIVSSPGRAVGIVRWNEPKHGAVSLAAGATLFACPMSRILHRWPQLCDAMSPTVSQSLLQRWQRKQEIRRFTHRHEWRRVATGTFLRGLTSVAYRPDGRAIATGSDDQTARVWELETEQELLKVAHRSNLVVMADKSAIWDIGIVNDVAFSPDGAVLATAGGDHSVCLWNARTGDCLVKRSPPEPRKGEPGWHRIAVWHGEVKSVTFSPNGRLLATGDSNGDIRLWDGKDATHLARLHFDTNVTVNRVRFSPDGRWVAGAVSDGTVRLRSPAHPSRGFQLLHGGGMVNDVSFSPDGRLVATGGSDSLVRIWDIEARREVARAFHEGAVWAVAFSPDGTVMATAAGDHRVHIRAVLPGPALQELPDPIEDRKQIRDVAFSPDGQRLAIASTSGTARVWQTGDGRD